MKKRILGLILSLVLVFAAAVPAFAADGESSADELYRKYTAIRELYEMYELDGANSSQLLDSVVRQILSTNPEEFEHIMNAMVETNEQYSGYFEADTYEKAYGNTDYYGIGVAVRVDESDYITVISLYEGPAKEAGILPGDRLVSVNGEDVSFASTEYTGDLIRGEAGTTVEIEVYRPSEAKSLKFSVKRGPVTFPSISCSMITDDIAYIYIKGFDGLETAFDFFSIQDMLEENEVGKVIIDVRGNRGGNGDVVLNILNYMIAEEDVTMALFRTNKATTPTFSTGVGHPFESLVVLADETSFSAAEIFVGVVKDLNLGLFVGTTTGGKGVGQNHIEFEDGSVLSLTLTEVILPKTGSYHEKGITPSIRVENEMRAPGMPEGLTDFNYTSQIKPGSEEGKSSDTVRAVEERLNILGYLSNVPDGNYDLRTQNAVKAYQKEHHMNQDGYISATIVRWLSEDIATYAKTPVLYDSQLEAALKILK
ncbi:MAG: PDZ domain-containing protein [Clostridia bacterium]|nr:PDZ domain-containing protein [Clostridia bacterium]